MSCPHLPYSQDLTLCDFWLFLNVKMIMKGKHCESIQDKTGAMTVKLKIHRKVLKTQNTESGKDHAKKCVK